MIGITTEILDVAEVRKAVAEDAYGAVLVFEGVARDHSDGKSVLSLAYEAYTEMAVPEMERIAAEIAKKWPKTSLAMMHRVGEVPIGAAAVVIAVGAAHREECYEANRYAIEQLKSRVPIWKKEIYIDGSEWKANATAPGG